MFMYEDQCVCCERCINCGNKRVPVLTCDSCGHSVDEVYDTVYGELCSDCTVKTITEEEVREVYVDEHGEEVPEETINTTTLFEYQEERYETDDELEAAILETNWDCLKDIRDFERRFD